MEAVAFYNNKKIQSAEDIIAKVQRRRSVRASGQQMENTPPSSVPNMSQQGSKKTPLASQPRLFRSMTGSPHHRIKHPSKKSSISVRKAPTRECSKLASQAIKEGSLNSKLADSDDEADVSTGSNSSSDTDSPVSETKAQSPPTTIPIADLSEYERQRQQNMEERMKFLASLNIGDAKVSLGRLLPPTPTKRSVGGIKPKRTRTPRSPVSVRKSLRLQERPADVPSPCYDTSLTSTIYSPAPPEKIRPEADLSLDQYLPDWQNKGSWQESLQRLQQVTAASTSSAGWAGTATSVLKSVRGLGLCEDDVAKVTPQRITTMAIHPSNDRDLVICGDKTGTLGVWMPDSSSLTNGAWPFEVHARGITRLTVDSGNSNRILTSSYDGSTRATDINANNMTQVFSVEEGCGHPTWHVQQDSHTLLITTAHGQLVQADLRQSNTDSNVHSLDSRKSIKLISLHSTSNNYFATANTPGTVCLWDCRKLRTDKPVCSISHDRTITGLNFSPVSGSSLLATCHDNTIRLLSLNNFSTITNKVTMKHDNHTGRWLTTLKADFLPGRDDLFIVGSMNQARVVEVWSSDGLLCGRLAGQHLTTFSTTVTCHPGRHVVAAANSSGRCHLFRSC